MGSTCGRQDGFANVKLPHFQMEPVYATDQEEQNLRQKKSDKPSQKYAKRVNQRPKLLTCVLQTIKEKGYGDKSTFGGVKLPTYYIPKKKGFYHGEWQNGKPEGFGRFYFSDGNYYQGDVKKGEATGDDCFLVYKDGSYKKGEMIDGRMNGKGVFYFKPNNLKYDGEWQSDEPHGKGQQTYGDDDFYYKGQFVNGKKHDDNGQLRWQNGKVYKGSFVQGFMQGQGKLYMKKGKGQYKGQFQRNLKHGFGKMKTQTGQYKGNFVNGEMEDQDGEFQWYDGKIYKGGFKNGRLHGTGQITFKNKQVIRGIWENGENIEINSMDPSKVSQIKGSKLF